MRLIENIDYSGRGTEDGMLDIYLPDCEEFPVFFFMHGGGLVMGNKKSPNKAGSFDVLVESGICVVSINYRLYPEAKYPDYIEDSAQALAWVFAHIGEYGRVKGIFVGGASAGGYLSMMLCFDKRWLGKYGIDPLSVTGWIHTAGQPTAHYHELEMRGIDSRRVIVDDRCPLYYVGMEEKYSQMLFIVSDDDMTNRYEQTVLMLSTLRHFGHGEDVASLLVMHGKHCSYVRERDENGKGVYGVVVEKYIREHC